MESFAIFALVSVFGVIYGANHQCWTTDQIADKIVADGDANLDGILQYEELATQLFPGATLGGECLTRSKFVSDWSELYHDHHSTANEFFDNLDSDGDGDLCLVEAAVQFISYDSNPMNGMIEQAELLAFLHDFHPDSPKNGGGGDC